jgi:toll-like receptor 13
LNDEEGSIMKHLSHTKLEILNLSMTNIKYVRHNFFQHIKTITHLILENNAICDWCPSITGLHHLVVLDLSNNKFVSLPKNAIEFIDEMTKTHGHFKLDISANPLVDECDTMLFLYWLRHTKVQLENIQAIFFEKQFNGSYSDLVSIIQRLQIQCASNAWVIVTGCLCLGMLLATIGAVAVNKNRWEIKYFCIQLSRRRKGYEIQEEEVDTFEYDAFVAYHNNSLRWVVNELRPNLEDYAPDRPIALCLHHRNWLPGVPIEENILNSIKRSRKTIVVLTRHFLRSNWCDFELQMARLRGFDEGQDIVIVIALEDIPINEMSETLINLRRSSTWLELPQRCHEVGSILPFSRHLVPCVHLPSSGITLGLALLKYHFSW